MYVHSNLEVSAPKWHACAAEWRTRREAETLTPADALQITHDSCVNGIGRRDSTAAATLENTNRTTVCKSVEPVTRSHRQQLRSCTTAHIGLPRQLVIDSLNHHPC